MDLGRYLTMHATGNRRRHRRTFDLVRAKRTYETTAMDTMTVDNSSISYLLSDETAVEQASWEYCLLKIKELIAVRGERKATKVINGCAHLLHDLLFSGATFEAELRVVGGTFGGQMLREGNHLFDWPPYAASPEDPDEAVENLETQWANLCKLSTLEKEQILSCVAYLLIFPRTHKKGSIRVRFTSDPVTMTVDNSTCYCRI